MLRRLFHPSEAVAPLRKPLRKVMFELLVSLMNVFVPVTKSLV